MNAVSKLRITRGSLSSGAQEVLLEGDGPLVLGRSQECDLRLADQKASRRHASISADNGKFVLEDLGSSHGTAVNGRKLSAPAVLENGDEIVMGQTTLVFVEASATPEEGDAASEAVEESQGVAKEFEHLQGLYREDVMTLKRRIHEDILGRLNLSEIASQDVHDEQLREKVGAVLDEILRAVHHEIPRDVNFEDFRSALMDDLTEYGPITPLLNDPGVSEVMVNGSSLVFVERNGKINETGCRFFDDRHLMSIIQRIVEPLGRRIDEASPMVDARLADGSRVNAIIPPLALDGPSVTIRKFATKKLTWEDLVGYNSLTRPMAEFLREAVRARQNCLISGGTGSGKTTLLNILSLFIPLGDRLVTIEDSAELRLVHRDLVRLEARPPNIEGKGRVAIRDLVINALRMRPDRIIVGECRGPEALDMLQAMNTGHDGSLTTIHANSPRDSMMRLENMVLMAGFELPSTAIREQIASAINLVVQQTRMVDGTRKVVKISEITGREGDIIMMQDIFVFDQTGFTDDGKVVGSFEATGNIPKFVDELRLKGDLRISMDVFKAKGKRAVEGG